MNTQHTPGPWTILGADYAEGTHVSIVSPNAAQVASVKKFDNWQANARLIAAAPDLLAALVKLEDFMRWAQDNADTRGFLDAVDHANVTQAQQAIAKATNSL